LFSFTVKLFLVSEQPFSSTGCHKERVLSKKKYHRDDRSLPELLSDNLSDVPDDILSDTESDSDQDSVTERKIVRLEKNYSDSETSFEESDSTSDVGATTWVKEDRTANLEPFKGNPGVKQILSDSTKMSEII
jgi:hypothetical protein